MPYPKSTPWTAAEDATLQALWGQADRHEIARAVGRSPDAVSQRAIRLGLAEQKGANPIAMERIAERDARETDRRFVHHLTKIYRRHGVPLYEYRGAGA